MTDISVVILVGNEALHIKRSLERLAALEPRQVFVVESQKGDNTHELAVETARSLGWSVCEKMEDAEAFTPIPSSLFLITYHDYPGYQAAQFQWALDNLPIEGEWILRLDADEYLTDELIAELKAKLPQVQQDDSCSVLPDSSIQLPASISGVILKRRHMWRNVWVKGGMYPTRILRLFRSGHGRSDGKLMDEHIIVDGGVVEFEHDFVDHSLIPLAEWEAKHRDYARREARSFLSGQKSAGVKGKLKWCYYHLLPSFCRPAVYWFKRAIISGAFFESPEARDFTYRHAFWYRTLVEREIRALKRAGNGR